MTETNIFLEQQAQIARLQAALQQAQEERDRAVRDATNQKRQLDKVDEALPRWWGTGRGRIDTIEGLLRDAAEQRALAERLYRYTKHTARCTFSRFVPESRCDCGLAGALRVGGQEEGDPPDPPGRTDPNP